MAIYKVIQDIEAEDKLIGPLTLRQFIYAAVAILFAYLSFLSVIKHSAVLIIFFLPITLVAGFLCWPWSLNQPTEVWALSKVRFILKPHRRIWDQSGAKELVTITAPKKAEFSRSNGLSQIEVKSRLRALTDVIDSRGWAIKNVNLNLTSQPLSLIYPESSDRLIDISSLTREVPSIDIQSSDDMLDENSPVAQHFQQMIVSTKMSHRDQIEQQLRETLSRQQNPSAVNQLTPQTNTNEPQADYWFMNNVSPEEIPPNDAMFDQQLVRPLPSTVDISNGVDTFNNSSLIQPGHTKLDEPVFANMRKIPLTSPTPKRSITVPPKPAMTPQPNPAILENVGNNDLSVAVIERLANQSQSKQPPDEVIVPLR
jgi:hypothetical protein